jgi:hypothetical protein
MGGEFCGHASGFLDFCTHFCDTDFKCTNSSDGSPRVCANVPAFGLGPVCVCEPQCPQDCVVDTDCYPFGLDYCMGGTCSGSCISSLDCPLPYLCSETQGMCECDSGNISSSCLGCGLDIDCSPPAACNYRNYETDPGVLVKECEYPCMMAEECPSTFLGFPLYCRWGEGNTPDRCACEPEMACQACVQGAEEDFCEPFSMDCLTISDPFGGSNDITGCTAPCVNDGHCPVGWYCFDTGVAGQSWCVESGCHCSDVECGTGGVDPAECMLLNPGFSCILDSSQDPAVELCTMHCMMARDCPMGYHCDDGSGTDGNPVCRCSMGTATAGR